MCWRRNSEWAKKKRAKYVGATTVGPKALQEAKMTKTHPVRWTTTIAPRMLAYLLPCANRANTLFTRLHPGEASEPYGGERGNDRFSRMSKQTTPKAKRKKGLFSNL